MSKKKKLGEMLLENGLVDKLQLDAALKRQEQWGGRLGKNLVELGSTSEINLLKFLSKQLNFPCTDLSKIKIAKESLGLISVELARKYNVMPLQLKESGGRKFLFLGMSDPTSFVAIDEVGFVTGFTVKPVIVTDSQIESAIEKYYVNNNLNIEPLTETVPVVKPEDMEIIHEVPMQELIDLEAEGSIDIKSPELLALLMILNEKGVLTKDEYIKKLKQLKQLDY